MSSAIERETVVISATNGKTTTATILAAVLTHECIDFVHNSAGANMPGGIATALLDSPARSGSFSGAGLFEVDEAWLGEVCSQVRPSVVVLANLFRDQLDRYGELEMLADSWRQAIDKLPRETKVVLNADDPLVAMLGDGRDNVVYFGIDDPSNSERAMRHAADSKNCRRCGAKLAYEWVQLGHLGTWSCPNCGLKRPAPSVAATKVRLDGMLASELSVATPSGAFSAQLPLPGLYNAYNALAAIAASIALGVDVDEIAEALGDVRSAFGRVEQIAFDGIEVHLLLVKNPTGANEVLRTIADTETEFDLWIALNDQIADGRDISWVWDADFERIAGSVASVTCSGRRADEMALRMAYAGVARDAINVDERVYRSFEHAAHRARDAGRELRALPTYTALLELRTELADHGYAQQYWSGAK